MRILIEEYQYPAEKVDKIILGLTNFRNIQGMVSVNHVGYYYNPEYRDTVFILPKVLLDEGNRVFGSIAPEEMIDLEKAEGLTNEQKTFIYTLSVWIYRTISVYKNSHPQSDIVLVEQVPQMAKGRLRQCNTYLDILLALESFNRENRDFFFFVARNMHSGLNKINWARTIAKSRAIVQDNIPIYLDPVNKKRQINFDEELLVIYFSILNYIKEHYGFPVTIDLNYDLIKGSRFVRYMKGYGVARLRQIKYKYFSDKALYLWELCNAFFEKSENIVVSVNQKEYLLVKDFNVVFEAMIDALVGTERDKLPTRLADQSDGKIVDHLWINQILLPTQETRNVYYIGDSKYYKHSSSMGENSVYKQFTYARNVIQWSWDVLMGRQRCDKEEYKIRLRDEETEGYNVIPNFFISATVDFEALDYTQPKLGLHNGTNDATYARSQFDDRLFDRDTLLLSHYDINFLFVIALYARNNKNEQARWKAEVRTTFRERVQDLLQEKYYFYALKGIDRDEAKGYLKDHFKELNGKIYKVDSDQDIYTLALEKKDVGAGRGTSLIDELKRYFIVTDCDIEKDDPIEKIERETTARGTIYRGKAVVVDDNSCKVIAMKIESCGKYGIGLGETPGALALSNDFLEAKYLVLHKLRDPIVFRLNGAPRLVTKEQMKDYPRKLKESSIFLLFEVGERLPDLAEAIDVTALSRPKNHSNRESYVADIFDLMVK